MTWLRRLGSGTGSSRLVCLPYAGGGGSIFLPWNSWLPPDVELWVADLPGREHRMIEEPVREIAVVVDVLAEQLCRDAMPTIVFGHSLGALLAFELARRLQELDRPVDRLAVSGMAAPQTLTPHPSPTDEEILSDLQRLGVAPREFFSDPDLIELVMPGLRADYRMALGYRYHDGPKLTSKVLAMGGDADPDVLGGRLEAWAEQTTAECEIRLWEGGHMFLLGVPEELSCFVVDSHSQSMKG
ncbi:alpha/beta fold hydrolase [Dactylosporangium sp. NPDC005572]|uniref:thioesterase II family protein n=1 Tax=Dactylosporangium sp. NPDC005572 TaxID=3156889 RepID=UPI0033B02B4F